MRSIRTPRARDLFLESLRATGIVADACDAAGIGRSAVYDWKNQDPDFSEAWEAAIELGVSALEDVATRFAREGNDRLLMFLLQAHRPDKYQPRQKLDVTSTSHVSLELRRQPIDALRAELAELLTARTPQITLDTQPDQSDSATVIPLRPNPTEG